MKDEDAIEMMDFYKGLSGSVDRKRVLLQLLIADLRNQWELGFTFEENVNTLEKLFLLKELVRSKDIEITGKDGIVIVDIESKYKGYPGDIAKVKLCSE